MRDDFMDHMRLIDDAEDEPEPGEKSGCLHTVLLGVLIAVLLVLWARG